MSETSEIWKDIPTWPYHQISNHGRVRVLPGGKVGQRIVEETELRELRSDCQGRKVISGAARSLYGHHLVLNAFGKPRLPGQECRHLNGDPSDNRLENLEWGTHAENEQDKVRHGTSNRGERHGMSKLTDSQATEIRTSNATQRELAEKYGVSQTTISFIRNGHRWVHL